MAASWDASDQQRLVKRERKLKQKDAVKSVFLLCFNDKKGYDCISIRAFYGISIPIRYRGKNRPEFNGY